MGQSTGQFGEVLTSFDPRGDRAADKVQGVRDTFVFAEFPIQYEIKKHHPKLIAILLPT